MRNFLFLLAAMFFFTAPKITAQEMASVILDSQSREPIPFATVQYLEHQGVVSNDEGRFNLPVNLQEDTMLVISSMGYETVEISYAGLKQKNTILLKPQTIQLANVFLTNKELTGEQVLERVKKRIEANYNFDHSHKKIFFRQSNLNKVNEFNLKVRKSTIPDINQELMNRISASVPKQSDSYKEVLGNFYGNYDTQKIEVIKAANLHNPESTQDLTELMEKLETTFNKSVKEDSYLKVRSGIFGVKINNDELNSQETESKEKVASEEKKDKESKLSKKYLKDAANRNIKELMSGVFWKEGITLNLFENSNKYRFVVEGFTQIENDMVYIISFKTKRGKGYEGKMYVNTMDYGVYRLDYQNVKPLAKFSLLGLKTASDIYRGKMIFTKDQLGKYILKYSEMEKGERFGIDRPLTIIEKNKNVKGRRKQNELDMKIRIDVSQLTGYQLVVYEDIPLDENKLKELKTSSDFEYQIFKEYDPNYWSGYTVMEPNAAIKAFKALGESYFE